MKIETHLSPNCSESAFVVVDWKNKKIIDAFDESSDSIEEESFIEFVERMREHVKNGYAIQQLDTKSGDGFHPEVVETLQRLKSENVVLDITDKKDMHALYEEVLNCDNDKIYETMLKHTKSKVELLADGYYGGKKNGLNNRIR